MDIDKVYIDYTHEFEEDLNMIQGFARVSAFVDDEVDEPTYIGYFIFNYYNMFSFNQVNDALISADAISGDEEYLVSTILYSDFEFEEGGSLVTLDSIDLKQEYKNSGLEKMILQQFLEYCSYMMFDYIAVIASKSVCERIKSEKIVAFPQLRMYESLGFLTAGGNDKNNPVMIKNLNRL